EKQLMSVLFLRVRQLVWVEASVFFFFADLPGLAVLKEHVLSYTEREGCPSSMTPKGRGGWLKAALRIIKGLEGVFLAQRIVAVRSGFLFPPGDACPSGAVGQLSFGLPAESPVAPGNSAGER